MDTYSSAKLLLWPGLEKLLGRFSKVDTRLLLLEWKDAVISHQ